MLFILALAIGVVVGALGLNYARSKSSSDLVRFAGAVAGAIIGFAGTYIVAGLISKNV